MNSLQVTSTSFEVIRSLRDEYRAEMRCQIVHDSWHARGFTNSYLLTFDDEVAGYGAVGGSPGEPKDIVKEFFVRTRYRASALPLFRRLLAESGARTIEAQTNDVLLSLMLWDCGVDVMSETILFADAETTHHPSPDVTLRPLDDADRARVFAHTVVPVGAWGIERRGELVATGGVFAHYNPPYGDIYMEVAAGHRREGYGSYLVQELKRICREMGMAEWMV